MQTVAYHCSNAFGKEEVAIERLDCVVDADVDGSLEQHGACVEALVGPEHTQPASKIPLNQCPVINNTKRKCVVRKIPVKYSIYNE